MGRKPGSKGVHLSAHHPLYTVIGATLAELRVTVNLPQRDVGKRMGRHYTAITHWESGRNRVSVEDFVTWCRALGAEPWDVLRDALRDVEKP